MVKNRAIAFFGIAFVSLFLFGCLQSGENQQPTATPAATVAPIDVPPAPPIDLSGVSAQVDAAASDFADFGNLTADLSQNDINASDLDLIG